MTDQERDEAIKAMPKQDAERAAAFRLCAGCNGGNGPPPAPRK